jgi:hypothetical protein
MRETTKSMVNVAETNAKILVLRSSMSSTYHAGDRPGWLGSSAAAQSQQHSVDLGHGYPIPAMDIVFEDLER